MVVKVVMLMTTLFKMDKEYELGISSQLCYHNFNTTLSPST